MAPITTASNDETHAALLDQLDMQKLPKPFRNPNWKPPQRRNKNLKQILSEAQRAQQSIMNTQQNSGATTPQPVTDGEATTASLNPNPAQGSQDLSRLVLDKNARHANGGGLAVPSNIITGPSITYTSIQAPPSLKPKTKYCDITGLPSRYIDPKTGLQYYNAEIYQIIKGLNTAQVQEYLAIRNANTVLKAAEADGETITACSTRHREGQSYEDADNITTSSKHAFEHVASRSGSKSSAEASRVRRRPRGFKKRKTYRKLLESATSDEPSTSAEPAYTKSEDGELGGVSEDSQSTTPKRAKTTSRANGTSAPNAATRTGRKRGRAELDQEAENSDPDREDELQGDASDRYDEEAALELLNLHRQEAYHDERHRRIMEARRLSQIKQAAQVKQAEDTTPKSEGRRGKSRKPRWMTELEHADPDPEVDTINNGPKHSKRQSGMRETGSLLGLRSTSHGARRWSDPNVRR
ncbi:chromatin-remodeling complex subunit ies6 [Recurvomyces mirabilis]|uniref:chromatin-remodeling complex subunit ies6 n=1 Tax=Recurvomyces mirabilis TaxID=574656 RepID=UPI002DE1BEEE|nr:chromatin-remodeling complex subunit ies6 [Recurvomyces mirabilis]